MTAAISSQFIMSSLQQSVSKLQSQIAERSKELSTGQQSDLGLALGNRIGRLVSLRTESSELRSITDSNTIVSGRLETTQSKLQSIQSTAQGLLQGLIASNGAPTNVSTVQSNADNNLASLISELNSTYNGAFLFAGTNSGTIPMTDYSAPSSLSKQAIDTAFSTAFGFTQSSPGVSGISGPAMQSFLDTQFAALFQDPSWSTNWSSASNQKLSDQISPTRTANTSVTANDMAFRQLAEAYTMLSDLGTQNLGADAYAVVTNRASNLLSSAIANLTDLQANVGAVQSDIADANAQMSVQVNFLTSQQGDLVVVDPYEVTSSLNELQVQLETSYSLAAQLRDLSLVNYL